MPRFERDRSGTVFGVERGKKGESLTPLSIYGELNKAVSECEDSKRSSSHLTSHFGRLERNTGARVHGSRKSVGRWCGGRPSRLLNQFGNVLEPQVD